MFVNWPTDYRGVHSSLPAIYRQVQNTLGRDLSFIGSTGTGGSGTTCTTGATCTASTLCTTKLSVSTEPCRRCISFSLHCIVPETYINWLLFCLYSRNKSISTIQYAIVTLCTLSNVIATTTVISFHCIQSSIILSNRDTIFRIDCQQQCRPCLTILYISSASVEAF